MIRGIFVGRRITIKFPQIGKKKQEVGSTIYNTTENWSSFKFKETQKKNNHQMQYVLWDNLGRELPDGGLYEVTRITRIRPSWYQEKIINFNLYVDGNILENTPENRKATNYNMGLQHTYEEHLLAPKEYDGVNNLDYLEQSDGIDIDIDKLGSFIDNISEPNEE